MRYAILLGILLIATPLLVRVHSADPWPNDESYRTLAQLREEPTGFGGTVMHWLYGYVPPQIVLVLLAAITLGAAVALRDDEVFVGLFAVSPAFLIAFTSLSTTPIIITLAMSAAALLHRGHVWALAAIPLCVAIDASSGILATLVLVTICVSQGKLFAAMGASFLALVSSSVASWLDPTFGLTLVSPLAALRASLLSLAGGAAILVGFLALVGFVSVYKTTKKRSLFLLIPLVVIVQSVAHGSVVLAGFFAYFAADALHVLHKRTWSFQELRGITLLILLSSIVFTTSATMRSLSTPDQERIEFMRFAQSALPSNSLVWASQSNQGIVLYTSHRVTSEPLPQDASFVTNAARERGIAYVVTRGDDANVKHLPLAYTSTVAAGFRVYEIPAAETTFI